MYRLLPTNLWSFSETFGVYSDRLTPIIDKCFMRCDGLSRVTQTVGFALSTPSCYIVISLRLIFYIIVAALQFRSVERCHQQESCR